MQVKYEDKIIEVKENTTVGEALKDEIKASKHTVMGAIFNNKYVNLAYEMRTDGEVKLLTTTSKEGIKIYHRTLIYILGKAIEKICYGKKLIVNYQLSNSMFCDIEGLKITEEFIEQLTNEMKNIVAQDLPIELVKMNREEAEKFYEKYNTSKGRLQFDFEENKQIHMFFCEEYFNYCYGTLGHRTGLTPIFEIVKYNHGFLVRYPSVKNPEELTKLIETKKLAWALDEYEDIHRILNVGTVYRLNNITKENNIKHLIALEEALHEKKIANIADDIAKRRNIKMILIAGPSSSGKTTFAQRLGMQLRINRLKPVTISVDNYFVERQDTPKDEEGKYDFECIESIDLELFNDHLTRLLNGEEIEMPEFDFHLGTKKYNGKKLKLEEDEVLVIEGIHCLNDRLTASISKEQKYKIYISALTVLNMDRFNRISTTDTRLIRRMVRDNQFRGYNAKHTISTWQSVNRGEERNIFPFQEDADSIFNTSLIYELGVLKDLAMPLLEEIKQEEPEFSEAYRLRHILKYFEAIPSELVPANSLLKEFIGGGNWE